MKVTLVNFTPNPLDTIEKAASFCYASTPTKTGAITKACYESGHHSVLEHASFTWEIEDVSLALLGQLTRHRIGTAFSVQSQRYVEFKEKPDIKESFVLPSSIKSNILAEDIFRQTLEKCASVYNYLLSEGIPKEDARFVLPQALRTRLTLTMNLRELVHFCNERMCSRAQWEIRGLANHMADTVNEATNDVFAYMFVPKCERDAKHTHCPEKTGCWRHPAN